MDRSLKLKLLGRSPDTEPQAGYEVVGSGRKQWPKRPDPGCIAANGDECSIVTREVFFFSCAQKKNCTARFWGKRSTDLHINGTEKEKKKNTKHKQGCKGLSR